MKYLIIILLNFSLFSCQKAEKKIVDTQEEAVDPNANYWTENHCMRSKPISTIDSSKVDNYTFELKKDRAIETATLPNGNKIIISNEGCEVFWLSYTVFINNYNQNETNIDLVLKAFLEVKQVDTAPIDFEKAINFIENIKEKGGNIKLGNEYFLKMDSVSKMFEIDEIDLKKDYATIEFSFAIGKL